MKLSERIEREYLIKLCLFHGEEVRSTPEKSTPVTSSGGDDGEVRIFELKRHWDGFVLLVENGNRRKNVHFHFRCTASQNASLSRPSVDYRISDVVPPLHRQIILIITRKNPSHSFTIAHHFHSELSSHSFLKSGRFEKNCHWPTLKNDDEASDIHLPQPMMSQRRQ